MKFTFKDISYGKGVYKAINQDDNQEHILKWLDNTTLPEVLDIEILSFDYGFWSEEVFRSVLRQKNFIGKVAEKDGRVTGYMIYELGKGKWNIHNLAVNLKDRRNGFATSFIEMLKFEVERHKRKEINMGLRESNLEAQLFCKNLGFRAIRTLRNFYDDTLEDCYMMRWRLDKPGSIFVPTNRISKYIA